MKLELAQQNVFVYQADASELRQVVDFLENRAPEENAWLIWSVYNEMIQSADWRKIIVCRRGGNIVGAADVQSQPQGPNHINLSMGLDAVDMEAAQAILDAIPSRKVVWINTYNRTVQECLDSLPGINKLQGDYYFTVAPDQFRPVSGDEVVELTPADANLFDGLENQPIWENADIEGDRMYAIMKDGIPAASLWAGPLIIDRVIKHRPCTICIVYVESAYRRYGLGKRLVSHVTEIILANNDTPLYWTTPENIASQSLCRSLGYYQYATNVRYQWTKP